MDKVRWLISLAVLACVLLWFEPARVAAEVSTLQPVYLLLALLITVAQTVLSAWRWRYTAGRLGLGLPWRKAISDYYLACFANQTLPGGVLGDAWRAQRHARLSGQRGPAWRAVMLERTSGQLLVMLLSLVSLLALSGWAGSGNGRAASVLPVSAADLTLGGLVMSILIGAAAVLAHRRWPQQLVTLKDDLRRALLARDAWPRQLIASLLIVISYALVFALAARAIGVTLPWTLLMAVALPILLAMLIPLSVAGWGWREAMAGGLWLALGLPPEQGVAVAMAYGVIVALGATPGALVWLGCPRTESLPEACPEPHSVARSESRSAEPALTEAGLKLVEPAPLESSRSRSTTSSSSSG